MSILSLNLEAQPALPFEAAVNYECLVLQRAVEARVKPTTANCSYGEHFRQIYDAYYPAQPDGAPVVIFWHGGGWTNGYKEYCHFMAPLVTALGAILILPNYRLAPDDRMPAPLDDCVMLLDHLAHDPAFPGDMRALHLSGHSAGGQLAAMTALRHQQGGDGWTIRSCLPVSGILELGNDAPPGSFDARMYDMVLAARDDDVVYSPICWAPGNGIPFILRYGEGDSPRVRRSNPRLAALLSLQSAPCECHEETDRDHFTMHTQMDDPSSPWYGDLARMLAVAK